MSKEKIFKELITEMAKDGDISSAAYNLLIEKGRDLGFSKNTVDLLIKLELAEPSSSTYTSSNNQSNSEPSTDDNEITFKSAITRGGSVLTPDSITITKDKVIYRKRNSYLINVDTVSIPISKISSVEVDSSIWGSDVIIRSYGGVEIVGKKFTKWDAKKIRDLILQRQKG